METNQRPRNRIEKYLDKHDLVSADEVKAHISELDDEVKKIKQSIATEKDVLNSNETSAIEKEDAELELEMYERQLLATSNELDVANDAYEQLSDKK